MWDDGARGGTACQRARLDPGIGPVRNRVEGSNPRPGKGVETIPQAAPAGHRRKNRGRGPAKLLALKIAGKRFPPRTRGRELAKLCRRGTNDTTPLCLRFALGLGQGCQACCAMSITSGFNFWLAKNNRSKSVCTLFQRKHLNNQTVWPVIFGLTGPICARALKSLQT